MSGPSQHLFLVQGLGFEPTNRVADRILSPAPLTMLSHPCNPAGEGHGF